MLDYGEECISNVLGYLLTNARHICLVQIDQSNDK
jgi:hypothetical protein